MKKNLFLVVLSFTAFVAKAQITISSSSFPHMGETQIQFNDQAPTITSPGTSGANQTWNFSALQNSSSDTTIIVSVASTPNGASFPNANFAAQQGQGTYGYLNVTANDVQLLGYAGTQAMAGLTQLKYTSPSLLAKAGITYNSNYNFTDKFSVVLPGNILPIPGISPDSIRINYSENVVRNVDGWGSLTTPEGTFPVLRVKSTATPSYSFNIHDTIFGTTTMWIPGDIPIPGGIFPSNPTTTYSFIDNNSTIDVMTLNMDSLGTTVTDASYRKGGNVGMNKINKPSIFTAFPNPSNGENLEVLVGGMNENNYNLKVRNIYGAEVFEQQIGINETAITNVRMNKAKLESGHYFISVEDLSGKIIATKSIEIVK